MQSGLSYCEEKSYNQSRLSLHLISRAVVKVAPLRLRNQGAAQRIDRDLSKGGVFTTCSVMQSYQHRLSELLLFTGSEVSRDM